MARAMRVELPGGETEPSGDVRWLNKPRFRGRPSAWVCVWFQIEKKPKPRLARQPRNRTSDNTHWMAEGIGLVTVGASMLVRQNWPLKSQRAFEVVMLDFRSGRIALSRVHRKRFARSRSGQQRELT
jgi:hypothetical protein